MEMRDSACVGRVPGGDGDGDDDGFGENNDFGDDGEGDDALDPDSMLLVWIPAVVVQRACPGLVRAYMERRKKRRGRLGKGSKGKRVHGDGMPMMRKEAKGKAKWRPRKDEEEEDDETTLAKPIKPTKMTRDAKWKSRKDGYEDEEEITPVKPLKFSKTKHDNKWTPWGETTKETKSMGKWKLIKDEEEEEETTPETS